MEDMNYIKIITEMVIQYAPLVVGAILTLIIGFYIAGKVSSMVEKRLKSRGTDPSLTPFLTSMINVSLKILVLLSAASIFGFEVTSFVAILSALAFAVGMALQGNLSHMAAGIMILFFKPFKVGDFIVAQGYSGTVNEIQIFNTILTTLDNRIIIVPNGSITSGPIENLSSNPTRKVPMTFGVGYSADIDKTRKVIQSVADSCELIDHSKPVDILVGELADSSVNFVVRPWCKTENYWAVHAFMHEQIKKAFDKENIEIPYPTMDLNVSKNA